MIRILVISPGLPYHGGAQMRAYRHAEYLQNQADFEVRLIALEKGEEKSTKIRLPSWVTPVRLFFPYARRQPPLLQMVSLIAHNIEIAIRLGYYFLRNRNQFDLVHSIGSSNWFNLISIPLARIFGKPVITEMIGHGHDPLSLSRVGKPNQRQIFPHRPLKLQLFLMADGYVSKSSAISRAYLDAGLPESKLFQIASAVDTNIFHPVVDLSQKGILRRSLGLLPDLKQILFVGRINHEKGVHWLIQAYRVLLESREDTSLILVGPIHENDREYAESVKITIESLGISDKVLFIGGVSNVEDYMRASDLFVLTSRDEGFSGSILEAMASELPIVASDVPGISESQIQNGVDGILVPVGNIQAISTAMKTLLMNPDMAAKYAKAARRRVEEMYTPQKIFSDYSRMYVALMSGGMN